MLVLESTTFSFGLLLIPATAQNIDSYDDDSNWSSDHTFPAEMSQIIGSDSHHEFKPNLFEFDIGLIHSTSSSILNDVMCKGVVLFVFPVLHVPLRRITGWRDESDHCSSLYWSEAIGRLQDTELSWAELHWGLFEKVVKLLTKELSRTLTCSILMQSFVGASRTSFSIFWCYCMLLFVCSVLIHIV